MLDLFTIFTKGGIVLWYFQGTALSLTPAVNALIKSVILQVLALLKNSKLYNTNCSTSFLSYLLRSEEALMPSTTRLLLWSSRWTMSTSLSLWWVQKPVFGARCCGGRGRIGTSGLQWQVFGSLIPRPTPQGGRVWGITLLGAVQLECHGFWIQQTPLSDLQHDWSFTTPIFKISMFCHIFASCH